MKPGGSTGLRVAFETSELIPQTCYLKNMKKFICLCLILWLPLFTGAALAMGAQMEAAGALQTTLQTPHAACHDMQQTDSQHQPATPCKHCTGHCFACGVCTFGCQAVNFLTSAYTFAPTINAFKPVLPDLAFNSQLYPPALKPPIAA